MKTKRQAIKMTRLKTSLILLVWTVRPWYMLPMAVQKPFARNEAQGMQPQGKR